MHLDLKPVFAFEATDVIWLTLLPGFSHAFVIILHLWLAIYVYMDAKAFRNRQGLFLDSPALWAFVALVTGLLGAAFYWLVHYSTLRRTLSK